MALLPGKETEDIELGVEEGLPLGVPPSRLRLEGGGRGFLGFSNFFFIRSRSDSNWSKLIRFGIWLILNKIPLLCLKNNRNRKRSNKCLFFRFLLRKHHNYCLKISRILKNYKKCRRCVRMAVDIGQSLWQYLPHYFDPIQKKLFL